MQLINFLKKNTKAFTWLPKDMSGINLDVAQHYLNIFPKARLVKQKPHKFALDHQQMISKEVDKMLEVGFIMKV